MLSDYYCTICNKFFEYKKEYGEERFPEHPQCPVCNTIKTRRKITFNSIVPDDFKSVNSR